MKLHHWTEKKKLDMFLIIKMLLAFTCTKRSSPATVKHACHCFANVCVWRQGIKKTTILWFDWGGDYHSIVHISIVNYESSKGCFGINHDVNYVHTLSIVVFFKQHVNTVVLVHFHHTVCKISDLCEISDLCILWFIP